MGKTQVLQKAGRYGLYTLFAAALVIAAENAEAKGAYALAEFQGSHDSKCVPRVSNPDAVLRNNGIRPIGASGAERQALGNSIAKIQSLLGGRTLPSSWRTSYVYKSTPAKSGKWTWNQGAAAINVRRPAGTSTGQNETRLIHELGHKIGNAGNYGSYNRAVGRPCRISPYCSNRVRGRNEEFAEALAAYATRPDHLKTVCPQAYAYFSQKLFPNSKGTGSCGETVDGDSRYMASDSGSSDDGYDRRQCTNLLCWLFGINRTYRTQNDSNKKTYSDPFDRSEGGGGDNQR